MRGSDVKWLWIFTGFLAALGLCLILTGSLGRAAGIGTLVSAAMVNPVAMALGQKFAMRRGQTWTGDRLVIAAAIVGFAVFIATGVVGELRSPRHALSLPQTMSESQVRDAVTTAQHQLARGDAEQASVTLNRIPHVLQGLPAAAQLRTRVDRELERQLAPRKAAAFAERVDSFWLPRIKAASVANLTDAAAIWGVVAVFEDATSALSEAAMLPLAPSQREAFERLRDTLAEAQIATYPKLRKRYGLIMGGQLWESEVDVSVGSTEEKLITFSGFELGARSHVADFHRGTEPHLARLRFSRAEYRLTKDGSGYQYDVDAPADGELGRWEVGSFKALSSASPG